MILEWLFERDNPGPVGSVELDTGRPPARVSLWWSGGCLVVALLGFVFASVGAAMWSEPHDVGVGATVGGVYLGYLLIAFIIEARPDTSNLGWAGGLFDNPLRYSDDLNRSLMLLQLVLLPGKILTYGIRDLFLWMAGELSAH